MPLSPLGCGHASCLLTGASTPPSREHPGPQLHIQPSTHFTVSEITYRHVCTYSLSRLYGVSVSFFSCFITRNHITTHHILLFYHPQKGQLVLSWGPSPLHPVYFLPSLLAPMGICTDPPSLDQWTLPCESQTLAATGYGKGS